jgi:hypothetical protein
MLHAFRRVGVLVPHALSYHTPSRLPTDPLWTRC